MLKFALVILVLGIVTYGVYSFMGGSDTDATLDDGQIDIHATLRSSEIHPKAPYTNNSLQIRIEPVSELFVLYFIRHIINRKRRKGP